MVQITLCRRRRQSSIRNSVNQNQLYELRIKCGLERMENFHKFNLTNETLHKGRYLRREKNS